MKGANNELNLLLSGVIVFIQALNLAAFFKVLQISVEKCSAFLIRCEQLENHQWRVESICSAANRIKSEQT